MSEWGLLSFLDPVRGSDFLSVAIKLVLATVTGGIIGLERRRKRRPAGFRTHILVCMGAVLAVCTNFYLCELMAKLFPEGYDKIDVSRLGAQVINGIGFLGAGTILINSRHQVQGLTTAAGLWASACMGLAIGAGYFELAVIACIFIYATITVLNNFEKIFTDRTKNMNISVTLTDTGKIRSVTDYLTDTGARIYDVEITNVRSLSEERPSLIIELALPKRGMHSGVITGLAKIEGVIAIEEV